MSKPFDVIIIGAGIIGATCFYVMTLAGKRCLLLDDKQLGCGVTGASGCIVRVTHASWEATRAAAQGYHFYRQLAQDSGGQVPFTETGYLHFAEPHALADMQGWLEREGVPAQLLDSRALAARYPALPITAQMALYEPGSGYMEARPTLQYLVQSAIAQGGGYHDAVKVHAVRVDVASRQAVGVLSSNGDYDGAQVIVAMGNGTSEFLIRQFGDAFGLWSQHIQVTRFKGATPLPEAPCFIDDINQLNGRPCPLTGGLYVGYPTGMRVPASHSYMPAQLSHAQLTREQGQRRFPWLQDASVEGALCHSDCYSEQPIGLIGKQPGLPGGVLVASGFSGGGFKMAPHVAMQLARVISQG